MGLNFKDADYAGTVAYVLAIVVFSLTLGVYALSLIFITKCDRTAHLLFIIFGMCEVTLLIA